MTIGLHPEAPRPPRTEWTRMRILSISNCPLIESQGSGYVILNFCRGLQARGHDVTLLGPDDFEPWQSLRRAKSCRQALGMLRHSLGSWALNRYDVVEFYGGEACLAASALYGRPRRSYLLVQHSNGLEPQVAEVMIQHLGTDRLDASPPRWYDAKRLLPIHRAFTRVDGVVTVSEAERQYALAHGYQDAEHVAAIEPCLPENYLGQRLDLDRGQTIGFCGSWLPRKGTVQIEADIARILDDFPRATFTLVGVGTAFRKETSFPSQLWPRIQVIPFADKEALRKIYLSLSILIVPSIHESFGLVTVEGMACGCAVVATRTGFASDLRDGEEAVLLERPVSPCLYEGVRKLLAAEGLRRRIARMGHARVQHLQWTSAWARLENLYQRWLGDLRGSTMPRRDRRLPRQKSLPPREPQPSETP
jgi:glycosyltransferase involved in cell wall biosynthesis